MLPTRSRRYGHVLASIIMFGVIYLLLFVLWIILLNSKIQHGPEPVTATTATGRTCTPAQVKWAPEAFFDTAAERPDRSGTMTEAKEPGHDAVDADAMTALSTAVPAVGPFAEDPSHPRPWICNIVWFLLLGVLLAGYAILDGFDLGVGILHLFAQDRRRAARCRSTPSGRSGTATRSGW